MFGTCNTAVNAESISISSKTCLEIKFENYQIYNVFTRFTQNKINDRNSKIGIRKGNSYQKNEEVSG